MNTPQPNPQSGGTNPEDATFISDAAQDGANTQSSLGPQDRTSLGETRSATPVSTVVDVGSQLGPYKLVDKLGEGGMGAVYKARHTKLGKFVAMKILPQHVMSRSDALARFEREMLAVGSLHHPNIVQAHDAGEFGGVHYLSMEYVEGQDLQQVVKAKGPMSVVNACKAIRQAAQGLAAAHKLGLVHRDIKPSNLFVAKQSGQIKILDMGLALLSQEEVPAALTSTGQCFGTPDYMAPEQWSDAHTCDARADLYSLGCTLFFLLVGHPPYHSETHRTAANKMKGHVIDPIPDLLAARSDIPDGLNAIYRKLMAKDPKDRFASADQLAEALAPFTRQGKPAPSSPQSSPHAPREESQTTLDTSKRSNSDAAPTPSSASLAPAIVSRSETATLSESPADQLGATSTWAGSSDAAASRSTGSSRAEAGPQAAPPHRPNRNRLFIAGGAAAFVLLLLGVIIITITNKDGSKTKIEVPGDAKVEITTKGDEAPTKTGWHGWPVDAPKPAIAPFNAEQAKKHQEEWAAYLKVPVEYTNSIGMKFRLIPPGEFTMGSNEIEVEAALANAVGNKEWMEHIRSERPAHRVVLTQPFYLGRHEVTQSQFASVTGANPSQYASTGKQREIVEGMDTAAHPVEMVAWDDAFTFCNQLSRSEGLEMAFDPSATPASLRLKAGYRVPTEGEWEFACRAGTETRFWTGDDPAQLAEAAWFQEPMRTQPVGLLKANPFGLHDVHGNVWEWVFDNWTSDYYATSAGQPTINPTGPEASSERVIRGGLFSFNPAACRSAGRHAAAPAFKHESMGFRAAVSVDAVRQALKVPGPELAKVPGGKPEPSGVNPAVNSGPGWKPIPVGESPFDKLDPAAIPAEERFEWQPQELVAVIGNHARRHWSVASVFISPDGKYAASNGDSRIIVWDMGTQTPLGEFPRLAVWQSFSEDSKSLYLHDGPNPGVIDLTKQPLELTPFTIKIPEPGEWRNQTRIENGRTLVAREYGGQQRAILVDVSGDQPVVGGTVSCWADGRGFPYFFWSNSGIAVYRTKDGQLRRVEIKDAKFVNDRELAIGEGTAIPVGIRADGQRVVLKSGDLLEIWDISGDSPKKALEFKGSAIGRRCSLSPDGRWLITSGDNNPQLWRIAGSEAKFVGWLDQTVDGWYSDADISQDGNRAIVGSDNGFVRFWDLSGDTPKELSPPNLAQAFRPWAYTRPQLDPRTGRLMLHTYDAPKPGFVLRSQLWDFSGPAPRQYPAADAVLDSKNGHGPIFSIGGGRWVNVGVFSNHGGHHTSSIHDGAWQSVGKPFGEKSPLSTVSPDGAWLLAFSGSKPGEYAIEGWDVREQPAKKWTLPFDTTTTPNGDWKLLSSHDGSVFAVAHGDGNGGEVTLFRHHGDRAEKFGAIPFKFSIARVRAALSPDGGWLVHYSESNGGPVVIADIRTGQAQELARKGLGIVRWLTFSPDGQRVAYASDNGGGIFRVGVLDAKTLAPLYEWKSPGFVEWLDFAPDARHLITLNGNRTVYVLRLPPEVTGQAKVSLAPQSKPMKPESTVSGAAPAGWHGWPADAPKPAIAPFDAAQAKKHQEAWAKYLNVPVEYTNSIGMKFRLIPPGEFTMGSTPEEFAEAFKFAGNDKSLHEMIKSESPQHKVILTQPLYLGVNEVTQGEYEKVMGKNPSHFSSNGPGKEAIASRDSAGHPVEQVSWNEAAEFCTRLSQQETLKPFYDQEGQTILQPQGTGYRLPFEAEWEFACRAGTDTKYWIGDNDEDLMRAGWFGRNSDGRTHATGEVKANPFGLHDMCGNVWEWCANWHSDYPLRSVIDPPGPSSGSSRMFRGGSWRDDAARCRSASRLGLVPSVRLSNLGFRISLHVDGVKAALSEKKAAVNFSNQGWHGWPADAPKPAIAPFDAAQAKKHQEEWAKYLNLPVQWTNSIGMTFQLIPPAEFTMGSSPEQVAATVKVYGDASWKNWAPSEGPQHRVVLTRPFYLGTHEVRQRDYESVMGNNPSGFAKTGKNPTRVDLVKGLDTSDHPVETVSWFDAAEFCAKLAMNEGLSPAYMTGMKPTFPIDGNGYRLPTEAEWEFTARAGSTTDSWNGDGPARLAEIAWCAANSGGRTHPVGQRLANPFGLFDMQGQVWEWCQDGWTQDGYQRRVAAPVIDPLEAPGQYVRKVMRGSFVTDDLVFSYATIRRAFDPNNGGDSYGLRVAIGIDAVAAKLNRPLPKQTAPIAKSNPFVASSDWKAARFLLDQGAAISIKLGGTYFDLSGRDKPLPMEPFRLVLVWCVDASRLTKDQIRELSQCPSLMSLTLAQLSLADDDVKPLTEIRSLSSLSLHGPKLTTQSLAAFAGASQLELFSSWGPLPAGSMSDALSKLTRLRDARVRYLKAEDLLEWSKQPSFARIRALHLGSPVGLTDDMIAEIQSRNPKVAIDIDNKIRGKWLTTDYINRMRSRGFVFIGKEYETAGASVREIVVDSQNGPPTETPYAIFGLKIQPDATFTLDDLRELDLFHLLVSIDAADVPLNDEALEVLTANVAAGRLYTMNFSGTKISPSSIRWLARLARAGSLDVRKTGFTRSMVDQLRRLLPEPLIFSDFGDFPPEPAETRVQDQTPSIDSIVARRIQELDGRGALRVETLTWEFGKEDRLPELPYVVDNVYLLDASQVTAADLENIARLRSLRNLVLLRLTVDDDALKPLEQLASLKTLALSGEKLSVKTLAPFGACPDLRDLNLPLVPRSDGISQALSDLSGLRSLALFDVKAADVEAYSQSPGFSRLRWLDLKSASGVDDSVVSRLQERNPKLQVMIDGQIRGKNVVKEAINTLRQRGVTFSGAVVTAGGAFVRAVKLDAETPPTDELIVIYGLLIAADSDLTAEEWSSFDRLSRFDWIHSEGNPKVSDAHVAAIADRGNLDGLTLVGAQLTDASVEHLARLRHLQLLNLRQTPLSRSAIERLRRLLPTTRIISEFGDETPDVPTAGNDPRIPVDAERVAALKLLRTGGLVMLQPLGASPWSIITVKPGEELPQGPFVIRSVNFRDRPDPGKVGDEVLRDLAECRHLEGLALSGTSVGPRGALYLGGSPALRYLHLSQKLPTSALRGLADLQALAAIELNVNSIDDDYAFLKSAKSLRALALWGTQSPDWKKLGELTQLRVLIFPDATNLNADEVAAFQAARPECRVLFGNAAQRQMMGRNVIDEATSALLNRKFEIQGSRKWNAPAEWLAARKPDDPPVVYVQSVVLRAEVTATESDCVQIDLLNGELQQFHADGQALADRLAETINRNPLLSAVSFRNSELTDAGLAKLQSLASLRLLVLDQTRVSFAGVEKFRQAVPGCQVIFNSETFDPQWLPTTHFDVNRRLAVRTLERGGTLLLRTQINPWPDEPFTQPVALPAGRFVIDTLSLKNCPTVVSSDLEGIGELRNLLSFGFAGSKVDAEAIQHLRSLRGLVDFSSGHSSLKSSDLDQLPEWPQLDLLWLNTKMINDGFKSLRRFPRLRTLNLTVDGPLPDLTPLGQFQNLRHVRFYPNSEVSSEVVRELQRRNPKLMVSTGDESGGRVLGENVARSAARKLLELGVPLQCNEFPSGPLKPTTLAEFDSVKSCQWYCPEIAASVPFEVEHHELLTQMSLFHFKASGCRHADALAKALIEHQNLRSLALNDSDLTDDGLKELSKLRSLRGLIITKTRVSRAAVEEFHRRVPDCWLQSDFGTIPPTFIQEATANP